MDKKYKQEIVGIWKREPSTRVKEILTSRALSAWETGCELNPIIIHFEDCVFSVIRVGDNIEVSYVN